MDSVSSKLPANLGAAIDSLFAPWARSDSPGAVVGVTHGGEIVHRGCYGMADLAHAIPLAPQTVVRIASQSKQFTVLLALMLEADGKLSLDDDVRRYCPWLPMYSKPITLKHLASNTSGLRDILEIMIASGVSILAPSSRKLARDFVARQRDVNFLPGEDLLYSNTNFLLLSEILEDVSGKSFNELLAERITGPLEMPDTRLMPRDDVILPRLATHHRAGPDGAWLKAAWGIAIGGEGGLVSSLDDMLRWQRNLRQPVVGTPEMFARMRTPNVLVNGATSPYGLGLVNTVHGRLKGIGHGGWIAGAKSESVYFPEADLGVVILANTDELVPFELARQVADLALGGSTATAISEPAKRKLADAAGTYRHEGDIFLIEARAEGTVLVTSMGTSSIGEIEPGLFAPKTSIPAFAFRIEGKDSIETQRYGRTRRFVRLARQAPAHDAAELSGSYYDERSGLTAEILCGEAAGLLRLSSPIGACQLALDPIGSGLFVVRQGDADAHDAWRVAPWVLPWLYTLRVVDGSIVLSSDRTKNLVFHRVDEI